MMEKEQRNSIRKIFSFLPFIIILAIVLIFNFYNFGSELLFGFLLFLPVIFVDYLIKNKFSSNKLKISLATVWVAVLITIILVAAQYLPHLIFDNSFSLGGLLALAIIPINRTGIFS